MYLSQRRCMSNAFDLNCCNMKIFLNFFFLLVSFISLKAEDGHDLWLRNHKANPVKVVCNKQSPTLDIARKELEQGWLGKSGAIVTLSLATDKSIKRDGYKIDASEIHANTEVGILYGVFDLLRRQQTGQPVVGVISNPSYERRILNHWDNLN